MTESLLPNIDDLIKNLQNGLAHKIVNKPAEDVVMVGIHTGGLWIAEVLHKNMGIQTTLGSLDISFYRDDFTKIGLHPEVKPSHLPLDLNDKHILLVDDVLYTGRTVRAALNELFDYGRPASVTLAVLVDRGERELPICAEVYGTHMNLEAEQQIKLCGPEPLTLTIKDKNSKHE